jgi:uncharacterized protein YndB with AHSA1/START domain
MEPVKELVIEKTYDASPETIWQAWTEPARLKQWWGPDNVTIPECEVDLRIGGKFYIVMEAGAAMGPYQGTKWPMLAEYTEVIPNSKLSYTAQAWTEGIKEDTLIDQTTEMTLTKENNPPSRKATDGQSKTKLKIRAAIYKTGHGAGMAVQGMQAGFTQQLEKLNDFLTAKK